MAEFANALFDICIFLVGIITALLLIWAFVEGISDRIAQAKCNAQNNVRRIKDEIKELRAKLATCEKVHQAEIEKKNKQIEERDDRIKELEEEVRKLRDGEVPPWEKEQLQNEIARLTIQLDSKTAEAQNWKKAYEHDIGYRTDITTSTRNKRTSFQEKRSYSTESVDMDEIYSAVFLNQFCDASKRVNNVLEPLLFSGIDEEGLCESIKGNAFERIEASGFEIEKVYLRCSTEPTEGNVWSKFGTHIPTLMPITGKTPLFIKIRSKQKNGTYKEYYTSLSSCTCESNIRPCKHSVFLAQQIGALYYNQEKSAHIINAKLNELKKEAAIKKPK